MLGDRYMHFVYTALAQQAAENLIVEIVCG
jgi:hypothetical protein